VIISTDEISGFPVLSIGSRVTSHDVAAALGARLATLDGGLAGAKPDLALLVPEA